MFILCFLTDKRILVSKLSDKPGVFSSRKVDIFFIEQADLGDLEKIKIGCERLTSEWKINRIEVSKPSTGQHWLFRVSKPLDSEHSHIRIRVDRSRLRSTGSVSLPSDSDTDEDEELQRDQDEEFKPSSGFTFRLPKIGLPKFPVSAGSEPKEEDKHDTRTEVLILYDVALLGNLTIPITGY